MFSDRAVITRVICTIPTLNCIHDRVITALSSSAGVVKSCLRPHSSFPSLLTAAKENSLKGGSRDKSISQYCR